MFDILIISLFLYEHFDAAWFLQKKFLIIYIFSTPYKQCYINAILHEIQLGCMIV